MEKENFFIDSLVDIYATSSISEIENSETTDRFGRHLRNYFISSTRENDMLRVYQLSLIDDRLKNQIVVNLSIFYYKEPKSGANKHNMLMYVPNYFGTKLGYVKFTIPKTFWDKMRNGIITGIFDFVDTEVSERSTVFAA